MRTMNVDKLHSTVRAKWIAGHLAVSVHVQRGSQTRRGRKIVERVIQRGSSDGDEKSWSESFERCAI